MFGRRKIPFQLLLRRREIMKIKTKPLIIITTTFIPLQPSIRSYKVLARAIPNKGNNSGRAFRYCIITSKKS